MPNKKPSRRPSRRTNPDPLSAMIDALNDAALNVITNSADAFIDRLFNPPNAPPGFTPINPLNNPGPQKPKAKPPKHEAPSLYDVLQVSPHADPETIAAAYKSLAKRYHPDIYKGKDGDEKMKQITGAYQILSDPQKRKSYDRIYLRS